MRKDCCEEMFGSQTGYEDVTDGSVENYDLDWPPDEAESLKTQDSDTP